MSDLSCDGGITIDDFAEVLDEALARRATAFKTDNGRSVLTAGTGLHAPKPTSGKLTGPICGGSARPRASRGLLAKKLLKKAP